MGNLEDTELNISILTPQEGTTSFVIYADHHWFTEYVATKVGENYCVFNSFSGPKEFTSLEDVIEYVHEDAPRTYTATRRD